METPKKLQVEYIRDTSGKSGKRDVILRFVVTDFSGLDEAMNKACVRARREGRSIVSANFRASKDGRAIDAIVVHVKEG